jgi:NDP-hexose 4-ketoreductase
MPEPSRPPARVLLLGASGFLGSHIANAFDNDPGATEIVGAALRGSDPRWRYLDLAGADTAALGDLIADARPDVVVNAIGLTSGTPDALRVLNVAFTSRLIDAIGCRSPGARLIHLGSAAEYGPSDGCRPVRETDEARPTGPYGQTKLAGTRVVQDAARRGLDTIVLRVFNPLGAGMDPRTLPGQAAAALAEAQRSGAPVLQLGPLGAARDFIAATDVASAVVVAAHCPHAGGAILNVGTGEARTARELVRALTVEARWDGTVDEDGDGSARSATIPWMVADMSHTHEVLGWQAREPFTAAVAALWAGTTRETIHRHLVP